MIVLLILTTSIIAYIWFLKHKQPTEKVIPLRKYKLRYIALKRDENGKLVLDLDCISSKETEDVVK